MKHIRRQRIFDLLKKDHSHLLGEEINVKGWVRTRRGNKNVAFIALNDGSIIHNIQIVVDVKAFGQDELLRAITTGSCISVNGVLVQSQGKGQVVEIQASGIELYGTADPEKYPLQKKAHTLEFLREIAHLRPRTNTFGAIFRIRHALSFAIHKFFDEQGFYYLHTPIITGSDAEGAGAMFRVTTLDPKYPLLLVDVCVGQIVATRVTGAGVGVSVAHTLLLGLLASVWAAPWLASLAAMMGVVSLAQHLLWRQVDVLVWPWALALLALTYGLVGYLVRFLRRRGAHLPQAILAWDLALRWGGWLISGASLLLALFMGVEVVGLTIRAVLRRPVLTAVDVPRAQMVVSVLALLGLFYLAAGFVDRLRWLGYGAAGMLLAAWSVEWLWVWGLREVQGYAIPAGVYLLGIGYLEWRLGSRALARWIDYAALLLLLGSSFWQSLGAGGWRYALLMGVEGLLIVWWGSARRLRRFLYAGVAGVIVDIGGQLIEPLLSVNRWIVFGVAGCLLIALAILIERRLGQVMYLSAQVRERLERWE